MLPFGLKMNYGRLSEICHVANDEYLSCFAEGVDGRVVASVLPMFNRDWSESLLSLHVAHIMTLAISFTACLTTPATVRGI